MPIRFRCAYCNQLMGIARRKAGSVVKCPKCAGEIIVPTPEGNEPGANDVELAGDLEDFPTERPEPPLQETGVAVTETSAPIPVLPPPPPAARLGVFLSIGALAVSVVVVILLLILMFVLGLIIGKSLAGGAEQKSAQGSRHSIIADRLL
jgi:hypothetical protein